MPRGHEARRSPITPIIRVHVGRQAVWLRALAALTFGIGVMMLIPAVIAAIYSEPAFPFLAPALGTSLISGIILATTRRSNTTLSIRGGFLLVTSIWIIASATGAIPFVLSGATTSFADALFESASGYTTTGSSVFLDVESLPRSILFWRSLTHWLGGMGIVVLAVTVLPMLGISGYHLMRAEAPGPDFERLTPRISNTGRILWLIYVGLTVAEILLLLLGGMSLFDSVNHSFATLATGGFSTRNASIAAYGSPYIEWVITIFMVLSGVNFALYFRAVNGAFDSVRNNTEARVYLSLYLVAVGLCVAGLVSHGTYATTAEAIRKGAFQVATLLTSTGFATADYTAWPGIAQGVLLVTLFVGGCTGSTSGGIKIVHVTVLTKVAGRHLATLLHPYGVFSLRLNRKPLNDSIVPAVSAFVFAYIFLVLISTVVLMACGTDMETGMTASLAAIGNVGPGFGAVGPASSYGFLCGAAKIWLSAVMILGRLELFTVLGCIPIAFRR